MYLRPLIIIFLFSLPWIASAQDLPDGLGKTCGNRQANAKRISQKFSDKAAQACRDAVEKSYEACGKNPADDDTGAAAAGSTQIRNGAGALRDKARVAQAKNTSQAGTCQEAKKKIREKCEDTLQGLTQAYNENSRAKNREINALGNGPDRYARQKEITQRHDQVARELEQQRQATRELRDAGEAATGDLAECYTDMARANDMTATKAEETLASANSDGGPGGENEVKKDPTKPMSEADKALTDAARNKVVTDGAKQGAVQTIKKVLGNGMGAAADMASGRLLSGAAGTALSAGTGGLGIVLTSASPAGRCSGFYTTQIAADLEGCRMSVQSATSALGN